MCLFMCFFYSWAVAKISYISPQGHHQLPISFHVGVNKTQGNFFYLSRQQLYISQSHMRTRQAVHQTTPDTVHNAPDTIHQYIR
jgi:hypothetical protein